ncbi:HAMP domain-containing methyl-accepting chemotaxis protein [Labrenzia sp. 011]|uniref:methyl-accepting chemotaxis protein n=1 Tax=Labrenzia sp. 011 TaxID=2171494 RepID=UPI0014037837|nr:HAMP domain-containing methyl-accepting chemotaxis protein [Labrenzia sp. 011]
MTEQNEGRSQGRTQRSRSIGAKIMVVVATCLAGLVMVAGIGLWQLNRIGVLIDDVANKDIPLTTAVSQITIHQLEQSINLERGLRAGVMMDGHDDARGVFSEARDIFTKYAKKVEQEIVDARDLAGEAAETAHSAGMEAEFRKVHDLFEVIAAEHKSYDDHALEAFGLIEAGQVDEALAMQGGIKAEEEKLNHELEVLVHELEAFTLEAARTALQAEQFALWSILVISATIFVASLAFAAILIRKAITRPLSEVVTGINALTSGDYTTEVKVHARDEIGAVAEAYQTFRDTMVRARQLEEEQREKRDAEEARQRTMAEASRQFVTNIGAIVETVSSASTELQATAQSMSSIAEETSSQATSVAAATEEATTNVATVSSATEELSSSIGEINSRVSQASTISQQAVEEVARTEGQMDQLAQTAEKIGDVISMISDIAEQTNLLALNATIESARAGEAGKGFAVVASEVKALASETGKATDNISNLIKEIQEQTSTSVASIGEIGGIIARINETSVDIATAMDQQDAATREIAQNVTEAARGTQAVSENIVSVTEASQETGAAASQVTMAAGELSGQASKLKVEVDSFIAKLQAA